LFRVALHGVQRVAGEARDEGTRGSLQSGGTQAVHGLGRALHRDQVVDRGQCGFGTIEAAAATRPARRVDQADADQADAERED